MNRSRLQPAPAQRAMCSGDSTSMASIPSIIRGDTVACSAWARCLVNDSGLRDRSSAKILGDSPAKTVTVDWPARQPRLPASDVHGEPASSSAKQKPTLAGEPNVARSTSPGRPPPTLRTTNWTARPMVELARLPWPSELSPLFMPMRPPTGPFTTSTGPTLMVVASTPCMLNSSVQAASSAAITTGRCSGMQPAITALTATFSTEHSTRLGGTTATRSDGSRVVPSSMRSTLASVGGTTGRPSDQPRSHIASQVSSSTASSTRRLRRREPENRTASSWALAGSTLRDPQPGRQSGSPSPRPSKPVSCSHSRRDQPTVRCAPTPPVTHNSVGTVSMS